MNDVQRKECVRLLSEMLFTLTVKHPVRADLEVIVHKCGLFVDVVLAAAEDQMDAYGFTAQTYRTLGILDGKCTQTLS